MPVDRNSAPAPDPDLPTHRSSKGEPAPGILRPSLAGRAGYLNRGAVGYGSPLERAHEEVSFALVSDDELDSSRIAVVAEADAIVLRGKVPSEADARRAQELAEQAAGRCPVKNELSISRRSSRPPRGK